MQDIIETDKKLKADMNDLQSDIAQKDIEILMLKQQHWRMQERLDKKILESHDIQNQLQSKDFGPSGAVQTVSSKAP